MDQDDHKAKVLSMLPRTADGFEIYPGMMVWMIGKHSESFGLQHKRVSKITNTPTQTVCIEGESVDMERIWLHEIDGRRFIADEAKKLVEQLEARVRELE